jgi:histone H3/H4
MEIGMETIRRIMKSVCDKPISTASIILLSKGTEEWIRKKTEEAMILQMERNKFRKRQGLRAKVKISEDLIEDVLNGKG